MGSICYLDVAPTSPNENTILRGGVVVHNLVDDYVFGSVEALLAHIAEYPAHQGGRLIVEWTVERDESNPRAQNRVTSRRIVGRTVVKDGKIEVTS